MDRRWEIVLPFGHEESGYYQKNQADFKAYGHNM